MDLTNNLEIWSIVSFVRINEKDLNVDLINFIPGEGVGINANTKEICMSDFAKSLVKENLLNLIPLGFKLNLKIIFPKGKFLSERTSNNAFGIVKDDGKLPLSLLCLNNNGISKALYLIFFSHEPLVSDGSNKYR